MPRGNSVLRVPGFLPDPGGECCCARDPPPGDDAAQDGNQGAGLDVQQAVAPNPGPDPAHGTRYSRAAKMTRQTAKNAAYIPAVLSAFFQVTLSLM